LLIPGGQLKEDDQPGLIAIRSCEQNKIALLTALVESA
jgi:hypothetical protein